MHEKVRSIAAMIDHTILRPDASQADVIRVCDEAKRFGFASVCVNGWWVRLVAEQLDGTRVRTSTVVGFPLGAMATEAKLAETEIAVHQGASEVDMVLSIGALKGGAHDAARDDVAAVVEAAHAAGAIVKVILETALLTDEEKVTACRLSVDAGADFVKTSTGFASAGATAADVRLMRRTVGPSIGVKASGGIRTLEDFRTMVDAGASRIGASASVKIVETAIG